MFKDKLDVEKHQIWVLFKAGFLAALYFSIFLHHLYNAEWWVVIFSAIGLGILTYMINYILIAEIGIKRLNKNGYKYSEHKGWRHHYDGICQHQLILDTIFGWMIGVLAANSVITFVLMMVYSQISCGC